MSNGHHKPTRAEVPAPPQPAPKPQAPPPPKK